MSEAVRQAREIQHEAADPGRSVVLEAAAGSGKTKVLVDRFLRLCLTGPGVDPRAVLAITFTRKATVEIMARLQAQARRLATRSGDDLTAALTDILGRAPEPDERARAAWFHESLLEDPAGLGVDTLHAFCQKVLGRFAAEAGLDPRFAVLDERQEIEYRAEALDRLELELGAAPQTAAAYTTLTGSVTGARQKIAGLFGRRVHLQRWLDRVAPPIASAAGALARELAPLADGLLADLRRTLLAGTPWQDMATPDPAALAPLLVETLREFAGPGLAAVAAVDAGLGLTPGFRKQHDQLQADILAAADALDRDPATVTAQASAITAGLLTSDRKKLRTFHGRKETKDERQQAFAAACRPVLQLLALPPLLELLDRNRTLLGCTLRTLDLYAAAKRRDRVVDFQDLEYLALRLLGDPHTGPQVHFRLDARLDHLLLDEFQDTNRNQWDLLLPLLVEILAGGEAARTAFVVGDVKQSIYGFRGADPAVFGAAAALLARQAGSEALLRLPTNFRSLPAIVTTVADLCQREPLRGFLGAEAAGARQDTARTVDPGRVVFVEPFARDATAGGHDRAAAATVALVQSLLDGPTATWDWDPAAGQDRPRALRHDDILILARNKTHLASYEAALRRASIPFTPAGRGLLARSREVQDVLALLRWLSYPADDIAGATVLRSPCCRVDEGTVQALLQARLQRPRRDLREVLRREGAAHGLPELVDRLDGWFRLAGLSPLHDLLRRIFREGELLERFETAGGEQARYNLLRLLDLALAAEARGGSLRDFVAELDQADRLGGEEEGALPGEAGTGRVRVMTVHGSKGLEAAVVILADAAVAVRDATEDLLLGEANADGPWVHDVPRALYEGPRLPDGSRLPGPLAAPRAEALARLRAEEAHILYVALTRARDRLYVVGGLNDRQGADQTGHSYLGWLDQADTEPAGRAARWRSTGDFTAETAPKDPAGVAGAAAETPRDRAARSLARLRAWTPPVLAPRFQQVKPSQLDDDRRRPGEAEDPGAEVAPLPTDRDTPATRRGTRIHGWLEHACRQGRLPAAPRDPAAHEEWREAAATFQNAALAWIFQPAAHGGSGLSEVPVLHRKPGAGPQRRVTGFIDRLVIRPDRVDIVDYKSNRLDGDELAVLVDHYRPQLAAYGEALALIYPQRRVRCWLLWTQLAAVGHPQALTEVML